MATVQTIFQNLQDTNRIDNSKLNVKQRKVVRSILKCKTKECGLNADVCECCGNTEIHYNSCRNPNCPQCQAYNREKWIHKQNQFALNVKYFHVVFTIPEELNPLVLLDARCMYSILFRTVAETLKTVSKEKKYLGASIGFTAVLHTWGQNLSLHPHIHCIVPGGGTDKNGKWINSKKKFFLPVKVLSRLFRGKFLSVLKKEFNQSKLTNPTQFQEIINVCYKKEWVVYTKKPMDSAKQVINYLGRYTHRIAISNARIRQYKDHKVTFSYKDYKDNQIKEMTLDDTEFFRRFMMHVLPTNFMKIRHYGFLGNSNKKERIKVIRSVTNTPEPETYEINPIELISKIFKRDMRICSKCGCKKHHKKE